MRFDVRWHTLLEQVDDRPPDADPYMAALSLHPRFEIDSFPEL